MTVRVDARSGAERRVRRAWARGPGAGLVAASRLYGLGAELRRALFDLGVLRPERVPVPVVSVGGLTAGGSGKTPLAAELAGRLHAAVPTAVVTHGYRDEMDVHRRLAPAVPVVGGRDRASAARRAVRAGAGVIVVDGGFQRLPLWRDADVVALRARTGEARFRLPGGSRRDAWSSLARADVVVVTRREAPRSRAAGLARWIRTRLPGPAVAVCALRPDGLRPANRAARAQGDLRAGREGPAVAVASIMYPDVFLRQLRGAGVTPDAEFLLPDHGSPDERLAGRIREAARGGAVVGTRKELAKLRRVLGEDVPLWFLADRVAWEGGERRAWDRLRRLLGTATEGISAPRGRRDGPEPRTGESGKGET